MLKHFSDSKPDVLLCKNWEDKQIFVRMPYIVGLRIVVDAPFAETTTLMLLFSIQTWPHRPWFLIEGICKDVINSAIIPLDRLREKKDTYRKQFAINYGKGKGSSQVYRAAE